MATLMVMMGLRADGMNEAEAAAPMNRPPGRSYPSPGKQQFYWIGAGDALGYARQSPVRVMPCVPSLRVAAIGYWENSRPSVAIHPLEMGGRLPCFDDFTRYNINQLPMVVRSDG